MNSGVVATDTILRARNIRRTFGGLLAVDVERLTIERNTITALIGPNGAGKTTLFNLLTGFDRADYGEWTFDGVELSGKPAYRVARAGMVRTFQLTKALSRLTVLDNMLLAAPDQRGERMLAALARVWRSQERENQQRALDLLDRYKLADKRNDHAGTLSGGQRKLLEMARALMVDPKLVMLDEPMAGVNPVLVESLLDHIRELRNEGRTVVFVEHDMDVVMNISERVVCMAEGRVIADAPPAQIVSDPAVIDAYLGAHHGDRPEGAQ